MNIDTLNGVLSSLLIVLSSIAIQFRNSGRAQAKALRELRDRDIQWALYVHQLRVKFASETGKELPKLPDILSFTYAE